MPWWRSTFTAWCPNFCCASSSGCSSTPPPAGQSAQARQHSPLEGRRCWSATMSAFVDGGSSWAPRPGQCASSWTIASSRCRYSLLRVSPQPGDSHRPARDAAMMETGLPRCRQTPGGGGNWWASSPRARLPETGEIQAFRPGIGRILERCPVPVVPQALRVCGATSFPYRGPRHEKPFRRGWFRPSPLPMRRFLPPRRRRAPAGRRDPPARRPPVKG